MNLAMSIRETIRYFLLFFLVCNSIYASKVASWQTYFVLSPLTHHWQKSPDHKHAWLAGIEMVKDNELMGAAYFKNSYNQSSGIIYPIGRQYILNDGYIKPFASWRLGVIYSYRGEFEDKVPLSKNGWLPAILPSVGMKVSEGFRIESIFLINRAVMISLSARLPIDNML